MFQDFQKSHRASAAAARRTHNSRYASYYSKYVKRELMKHARLPLPLLATKYPFSVCTRRSRTNDLRFYEAYSAA
jgi:hypothetical protein